MEEPIRPIPVAMDMMFTILVLYVLTQWSSIGSFPGKILFIFTALVVVNDWLSFRESSDVYNWMTFIIDLLIVFVIANMAQSLSRRSVFGYGHEYWLYFGILGGLYMLWDYIIAHMPATSVEGKKRLLRWIAPTSSYTVMALVTYIIQAMYLRKGQFLGPFGAVAQWVPVPTAVLFLITLYNWNREKLTWLATQLSGAEHTDET